MSRKFLLGTVAGAALLTSPAFAADLPVKASLAPLAAWSWAGFYLGAHGGYGWKENDFSLVLSSTRRIGGIDSQGWAVGGQAGYNWQIGRLVAGLEIDGSATRIRGDSAPSIQTGGGTVTDTRSDDVRYLGTARARVGGVPFNNMDVLLYGTAGLAWERDNRLSRRITDIPPTTQISATQTPRDHFGWVAGVGGEFRIGATDWIGRIEYLHYDFGTVEPARFASSSNGISNFVENGGRQTIDVVRGGLSYKFNAPASPYQAYAASMPVKAVAPAAAWSWTGFYAGAHGGYGWKQNDFNLLVFGFADRSRGIHSDGAVFGGQAGYNWQSGRWVTGFEIDGSAIRIRGDGNTLLNDFGAGAFNSSRFGDDVQYLGSVRTRVGGIPFSGLNAHIYGTAGLAWERANRINTTASAIPPDSFNRVTTTPRDHFGWVAGVGGEFRIGATNWIGRVEYLHYDFGTVETAAWTVSSVPGGGYTENGGRQTIDVVRAGLSYKLNSPASPLSAYASIAPPPPVAWSWTGFYIGAHGGYGWGDNEFTRVAVITPLQTFDGINSKGWVFGGQAGYNWQFDRWVAGLELDGSASQIRGDSKTIFNDVGGGSSSTGFLRDDVKYMGTLRARVGGTPLATADVMLYGTAGLAWERINRVGTQYIVIPSLNDFSVQTIPADRFGWVAGVGGEFRIGASNWIGRVEYLHYDFGSVETLNSLINTPSPGSYADASNRQTIDVVRGGVSYKFAATP